MPGLLIKQLGRDLTPIEVQATFKRMDTNEVTRALSCRSEAALLQDGLVSFSEYMANIAGSAWEGYSKSSAPDDAPTEAEDAPVEKEQKEKAAVKIQSSFRGKSARRKVRRKKGQEAAKRNSRKAAREKKVRNNS